MATISPLKWLLLLVAILHCGDVSAAPTLPSIGCLGRNCYYLAMTERNWNDAKDMCRSHDKTYLAEIPNNETRHFLQQAFAKHNVQSTGVWFGGRQIIHNTWRWLNNVTFDKNIYEYSNADNKPFCGVLNHMRFEGSSCTEEKRFLCTRANVDANNPQTYYLEAQDSKRMTWHKARDICIARGMDLASVTSNSTSVLKSLISPDTNNFWMGLVKSTFVNSRDGKEIRYLYFKTGTPYSKTKLCLKIESTGEFGEESCSTSKPFLCLWVSDTAPSSTTKTPTSTSMNGKPPGKSVNETGLPAPVSQNKNKTGLIVGIAVVVVIIIIIVAIVVGARCTLKKKDKKHVRKESKNEANGEAKNEAKEESEEPAAIEEPDYEHLNKDSDPNEEHPYISPSIY